MKLSDFRSYQLALQFYRLCSEVRCPAHLRDQLLRAASSVALNLAEGSAKASLRDRQRFYSIAMASARECQAVLDLVPTAAPEVRAAADALDVCPAMGVDEFEELAAGEGAGAGIGHGGAFRKGTQVRYGVAGPGQSARETAARGCGGCCLMARVPQGLFRRDKRGV